LILVQYEVKFTAHPGDRIRQESDRQHRMASAAPLRFCSLARLFLVWRRGPFPESDVNGPSAGPAQYLQHRGSCAGRGERDPCRRLPTKLSLGCIEERHVPVALIGEPDHSSTRIDT